LTHGAVAPSRARKESEPWSNRFVTEKPRP
jgi:hypothetical protein